MVATTRPWTTTVAEPAMETVWQEEHQEDVDGDPVTSSTFAENKSPSGGGPNSPGDMGSVQPPGSDFRYLSVNPTLGRGGPGPSFRFPGPDADDPDGHPHHVGVGAEDPTGWDSLGPTTYRRPEPPFSRDTMSSFDNLFQSVGSFMALIQTFPSFPTGSGTRPHRAHRDPGTTMHPGTAQKPSGPRWSHLAEVKATLSANCVNDPNFDPPEDLNVSAGPGSVPV